MFGENLTTAGVDVSGAIVGERWRIGELQLEVCQPRLPCFKLGLRFGDPQMLKRFAQAERPGAYLRILAPGEIGAGDEIELVSRPDHGVSVRLVSRALLIDETLLAAGGRGARAARRAVELDARARRLISGAARSGAPSAASRPPA